MAGGARRRVARRAGRSHACGELLQAPAPDAGRLRAGAARARGGSRPARASAVPMHPSFEDRPGAPDPVLAAVPPAAGDHLAAAWERMLARGVAAAARRRPPASPDADAGGGHARASRACRSSPTCTARRSCCSITSTGCAGWPGSSAPTSRGWPTRAAGPRRSPTSTPRSGACCARPAGSSGASATTGRAGCATPRACRAASSRSRRTCATRRGSCSTCLPRRSSRSPTGSTSSASTASSSTGPNGWGAGGTGSWRTRRAGTSRGGPARFATARRTCAGSTPTASDDHAPVLMFVGRFTEVKRVPLLLRAYARARERFTTPAPLVLWGGFTGEWEGEHPVRRRARGRRGRDLLRRLARSHRAARGPHLRGRDGRALRARGIRPDADRGDVVRRAGDRDAQRRARCRS